MNIQALKVQQQLDEKRAEYAEKLRFVLQCVAVRCRASQRVAVCCSVLQCTAACCSWMRNTQSRRQSQVCVLQCVAVCYNVMQCVAVRYSALQCVANEPEMPEHAGKLRFVCQNIHIYMP